MENLISYMHRIKKCKLSDQYSYINVERNSFATRFRVKMERDGTRAETRFGLPAKRKSPFISAGLSV